MNVLTRNCWTRCFLFDPAFYETYIRLKELLTILFFADLITIKFSDYRLIQLVYTGLLNELASIP